MLFFLIIGWIFGVYLMHFSHLIKWRADLNESLILFKVYDHWPLDPWRTDPNQKSSILERPISFKIGWTFYSEGVIRMKNFTALFLISYSSLMRLFDQLGLGLCIVKGWSEWKIMSLKDWSEWKIKRKNII